jgi:VWFA-related protein
MRRITASALIVLVLLTSLVASTQQDLKEKKQSKEAPLAIKLHVSVLDSLRGEVLGVTADRVQVFEDDVLQTVSSIEQKSGLLQIELGIDSSGSMRSQFGFVVTAAKLLVDSLGPNDKCHLFRFVSSDKISTVVESTSNKADLKNGIDSLYVEGGPTAIIDAVYAAATRLGNSVSTTTDPTRVIVVFTDGENRSSSHKEDELFKLLEEAKIPVLLIAPKFESRPGIFDEDKTTKLLNKLAVRTGGIVHVVNSLESYQFALNAVLNELQSRYVVSYNSSNPKLDGKRRNIRVQIVGQSPYEKFTVMVRDGYTTYKK